MSKFNAKSLLDATMKFKLTNQSSGDMPINSKQIRSSGNMGSKINKYIAPKSGEKNYSLCKMYDSNLDQLEVEPIVSQNVQQREKTRKFNFVMDKLNS
jgi:hypothetical protein